MATVNQTDEQQNGQQGPQPISGTGGASASGRGTAGAAAAPAGASNVQNNAGQNAGYTDVGAYLNANQAGSNQLGGQVAQNLTNQYNTTKQGIDTSSQNFAGQVNQGYVPENTDLINQVAANPTGAASNPNQVSAYQAQLNDQYTGPSTWGDYGTLQGTVNQANQQAALANTPGGNNVLAQQVESPTASGGVNSLDALLLSAPGAAGQVQAAAAPYAGLNDYLNAQNTANTGAITAGQNAAQQASQDALNAFTGANGTLTNLNNTINQTTANDLSQAQQQQAAIKQALGLGNIYGTPTNTNAGQDVYGNTITNYNVNQNALSPQILQQLGLTQDQWNQLSGALQQEGTTQNMTAKHAGFLTPTAQSDLSTYLSQQDPTAAINAGTVATPEQYQQMAAIQSLLGSKTPQGSAINPALASLAGTYNPNSLNTFDYAKALQDAQNFEQSGNTLAQNQANALSAQEEAQHNASSGGFLKSVAPYASWIANPALMTGATTLQKQI